MKSAGRNILIFGGTFDPPHQAHTTLPPLIAHTLGCNRILYIPAAISPHKQHVITTPAHHRIAMLTLALADIPEAKISMLEMEREGVSYTVDTLEILQEEAESGTSFRLLIGADQALAFHKWKSWRRILDLAPPAVMLRPPLGMISFHEQLISAYGPDEARQWIGSTIPTPILEISATDIRHRLACGQPLGDLVAPAVLAYIRREHLYGVQVPGGR